MSVDLSYIDAPIVSGDGSVLDASPSSTPTLISIGQASGMAVACVRPPDLSSSVVSSYTLYRATAPGGPWTAVDTRAPSRLSRWVNLFDQAPPVGVKAFYYAATDGGVASNQLPFVTVAQLPAIAPGGALSAGAFGQYPLLGSDVYLDPGSGEAVIGPNGDMLAVNGLELLGQDLRTRFTTIQGELLLHQGFGRTRKRIIGSGQGDPIAQARLLQTQFVDLAESDPRVDRVEDVEIRQVAYDSWTISISLIAIGAEDAGLQNLVFPYYLPR